jgi:hypothetical protein
MHGVDYPHPEGSWGDARAWMRATFGRMGVGEREVRLMIGENAVRLHNLHLKQLRPIAERVGPTVEEVITPATDEEVEQLVVAVQQKGRGSAARAYHNAAVKSQAIAT